MADTTGRPTEVGTSYFGVRDPKHARRDLDRFKELGLDGILHTFSERDRRYYQGTLSEIVSDSHERGFTVYVNPWGLGRVFGGEAFSEFTSRYPEACQRLSNGRRAPAACFNAPAFREFVTGWIEDATAIGADYLFWDEPHWYTADWRGERYSSRAWTCRCRHCQSRFQEINGRSMPDTFDESVRSFRNDSLMAFLEFVTDRTAESGLRNVICLEPEPGDDLALNWDRVASLDQLDTLATTPFWGLHGRSPGGFVGEWGGRVVELARSHEFESQLWVQGFDLEGQHEAVTQVREAVEAARALDPDSVFLWGWDGCRVISSIASETPGSVWSAFLEAAGVTVD